jgi:hypothetical protein
MRKRYVALAVAPIALVVAGTAGAGTLSTGFLWWHEDLVEANCNVTNVGSKPITITAVWVLDGDSTALVPESEGCSQAPLAPGRTCFWDGGLETSGGSVEFKGAAKSLRGRCTLVHSETGNVLGPEAELR